MDVTMLFGGITNVVLMLLLWWWIRQTEAFGKLAGVQALPRWLTLLAKAWCFVIMLFAGVMLGVGVII